jgi:hypothetical protein
MDLCGLGPGTVVVRCLRDAHEQQQQHRQIHNDAQTK